jgi:hypothetical protein
MSSFGIDRQKEQATGRVPRNLTAKYVFGQHLDFRRHPKSQLMSAILFILTRFFFGKRKDGDVWFMLLRNANLSHEFWHLFSA